MLVLCDVGGNKINSLFDYVSISETFNTNLLIVVRLAISYVIIIQRLSVFVDEAPLRLPSIPLIRVWS